MASGQRVRRSIEVWRYSNLRLTSHGPTKSIWTWLNLASGVVNVPRVVRNARVPLIFDRIYRNVPRQWCHTLYSARRIKPKSASLWPLLRGLLDRVRYQKQRDDELLDKGRGWICRGVTDHLHIRSGQTQRLKFAGCIFRRRQVQRVQT